MNYEKRIEFVTIKLKSQIPSNKMKQESQEESIIHLDEAIPLDVKTKSKIDSIIRKFNNGN